MEWLARRSADIVLLLGGAIFLGVGLAMWIGQQPIEGGVDTTGTIVDLVVKVDSDNSRSTFPVIEFTDQYERTHRFQNKFGGSGFGVEGKIGQVVKVRYDPDKPSRAQWVDQPGAWVPLVGIGVGIVLLLCELGLVVRRVLRHRRQGRGADPEPSPAPG